MNSRSLAFIWLPGFIFLTVISTYAQPVPEEAKRFYARGQAALEMATTPADYDSAIVQFTKAASLAPNWPDVYYIIGQTQEKIEKYADAIVSYKKYLQLSPNAANAEAVKSNIYKLEYKAEKEGKKTVIINGLLSGVKERKHADGFSFLAGLIFKKTDAGIILDVVRGDYPEYNQKNIPVTFDGQTIKMTYLAYRCPHPGMSNFDYYPCEEKHSFTGKVVSANPLVLDVNIVVKLMASRFSNQTPSVHTGQWIFNK